MPPAGTPRASNGRVVGVADQAHLRGLGREVVAGNVASIRFWLS